MEKSKRRKEGDDFTLSSIDKISELPVPILHHIICFLPQNQAAQTCLLSKSWCNIWCTRPNIEFRQPRFGDYTEYFLSIIDHTLQRYYCQNLSIKKFVVDIWGRIDSELIALLEIWIPIVLMKSGVETFHLTFPDPDSSNSCYYYSLPSAPVVFGADFLTELCLTGFKISFTDDKQLCLKHLKMLSLETVYIEDEALAKIMASCPLVEHVDLWRCYGLTTVDCVFSGHTSALETITIAFCHSLYLSNRNTHHFPHLKSLYLSNIKLPKKLFGSFSCNYPCLEDLEIRGCSGLTDVVVLSCSVKRLIIANTKNQIKTVTIDAPHILYFEFSSYSTVWPLLFPSVSFATVATSKEWESSISVPFVVSRSNIDISPLCLMLSEVLKALRQSRITLNLDYLWSQHIKDIKYAGCCEPPVVEHLKLRGYDSSDHSDDDFAALFNCLFKIFRPRYIYMRMHPDRFNLPHLEMEKLAEFISKINLKDGDFSRCYFWQQELKEINVEILDHDSSQWRLKQGSNLTVCALENNQAMENIRFGFEWRE